MTYLGKQLDIPNVVGKLNVTAIKTANYTAVSNDLVRINSAGGTFTVTLPSTPWDGDIVGINDVNGSCGTTSVLLAVAGGKTVEGDTTGININMANAYLELMYYAPTNNWKMQSTPFGLAPSIASTATPVKTSAYSALVNDLVRVNSSGGAFTVTLPSTPLDGSVVSFLDITNSCAANPVLIAVGGSYTVEGDATGISMNINGAYVQLIYNSLTTNWKLENLMPSSNGVVQVVNGGTGSTTAAGSPFALKGANTDITSLANATYSNINGGPLSGFRNKIINGSCQIAQRGNVAITQASGAYVYGGCDRITVGSGSFTTLTGTISQYWTTVGPTPLAPSGYGQFLNNFTTTGSGYIYFSTRLESKDTQNMGLSTYWTASVMIQHDIGSTINVSGNVFKATAIDNFTSVASLATNAGATISVPSGVPTRVYFTFPVVPADLLNGLQFMLSIPVNAVTTKNIYTADWRLEPGSTIGTYAEQRPYTTELALCQRYYYNVTIPTGQVLGAGPCQSTTAGWTVIPLPVAMRSYPTPTYSGPLYLLLGNTAVNITSCNGVNGNANGTFVANISWLVASGLTAGYCVQLYANGGPAYVYLNAEL